LVQYLLCAEVTNIWLKLIPVYFILFVIALSIPALLSWGAFASTYFGPFVIFFPASVGLAWVAYWISNNKQEIKDFPTHAASIGRSVAERIKIKVFYPFGLISVFFYFPNVFLERMINSGWYAFAEKLPVLTTIFSLCLLFFSIAMYVKSIYEYHFITRAGYFILIIVSLMSLWKYSLFPYRGYFETSSRGIIYNGLSEIIIFATLILLYVLAVGYLSKEKMRLIGFVTFFTAIIMTLFVISHIIELSMNLAGFTNTGNLMFSTQLAFICFISYMYTFRMKNVR